MDKEYRVDVYTRDDKALFFGRTTYPIIDETGALTFRDLGRNIEIVIPERNLSYFTIFTMEVERV